MTAEEARSFGGFSVANAAEVMRQRPCGCWIALGFVVRKGEKAIRIPVVIHTSDEDGETPSRRFVTSAVFCRCQVVAL